MYRKFIYFAIVASPHNGSGRLMPEVWGRKGGGRGGITRIPTRCVPFITEIGVTKDSG